MGGIGSELSGGSFRDGIIGAAASAALRPLIGKIDAGNTGVSVPRIVAAAIIGGTASKLGGGKFANGAASAAFSQLATEWHAAEQQRSGGLRLMAAGDPPTDNSDWEPLPGDEFAMPAGVRFALSQLFGRSVDSVTVFENSPFARQHGFGGATTRVDKIYLDFSGDNFLRTPFVMIEEYYHVLRQWNTGRVTELTYVLESMRQTSLGNHYYHNNAFEVEAKTFANENLARFQSLRTRSR